MGRHRNPHLGTSLKKCLESAPKLNPLPKDSLPSFRNFTQRKEVAEFLACRGNPEYKGIPARKTSLKTQRALRLNHLAKDPTQNHP